MCWGMLSMLCMLGSSYVRYVVCWAYCRMLDMFSMLLYVRFIVCWVCDHSILCMLYAMFIVSSVSVCCRMFGFSYGRYVVVCWVFRL